MRNQNHYLIWLYDSAFVGLFIGALYFFMVFGIKILDPTQVDWVKGGDVSQHFVGWQFFRFEDWQFPPGKIATYGMPEGTSLVFTDSIPLFGLFFKAFRIFLPMDFQYFGIWFLCCYLLQGCFGWLLASKILVKPSHRILATGFFVVCPIVLKRAYDHQALVGQWVLLGALYLFLLSVEKKGKKEQSFPFLGRWTCLIVITALIHFYLCAMVLAIYLGYGLVGLSWRDFTGKSKYLFNLVLPFVGLIFAMYLAGYFAISSNSWSEVDLWDFGFYSMNLLAPLNPMGCNPYMNGSMQSECDSVFLKKMPFAFQGQSEGFNYLGMGMLLLMGVAFLLVLVRGRGWKSAFPRFEKPQMILLILSVSFTVFSISNVVTFSDHILFNISTNYLLKHIFVTLRSSGRFFWFPYYLVMFGTFYLSRKFVKKDRMLTSILAAAFAFQLIDLFPLMNSAHQAFAEKKYANKLPSPRWEEAMNGAQCVLFYPRNNIDYLNDLAYLTAPRKIGLNLLSAARKDQKKYDEFDFRVFNELKLARLRKGALYVFNDPGLLSGLSAAKKENLVSIQLLDGLYAAKLSE